MPKIQQSQHSFHLPEQLYQLVNDIERYPQFLPGCSEARILSTTNNEICAELFIQKGPVQLSFATRNQLTENQRIDMQLLKGPFKSFHGVWSFETVTGGATVSLEMDFELNNVLLQLTLGPLFQKLAQDMVHIFIKRAKEVYGVVDAKN